MTISHILKWTLLVWLNAALSFFLAINNSSNFLEIAGIVCAVFTFVAVYSFLDYRLIQTGNSELQERLFWSVCIKTLTQFIPCIEIMTGAASISFISESLKINTPFLSTYLITMVDGALLSLFVLLLMPLVGLIRRIYKAQAETETS